MQFTQEQEKPDNKLSKDPLLEALEKTLEESRRLRGEIHGDGPPPPLPPHLARWVFSPRIS
ncbi:MAG TPA: hypothetical protein VLB76_05280 [Thermoanaerobaculia bacterium]|jgi:hypothetical protein|nr:hypothetical protein [Thermoanaerobaculia bacterium]